MSSSKAKIISISLSSDMTEEVQAMAKEERRSVSEVIREAIRQYAANKELEAVGTYGRKIVKKKGIKPDDIARIVREGRR